MTTAPATPLDQVLSDFVIAGEIPTVETLEQFTKEYPAYADILTEFAVELLLDSAISDEDDVEETAAAPSAAVSRAISHFQNTVYALEQGTPTPTKPAAQSKNPFAELEKGKFREVAKSLHANNTFMIKLRDRSIDPDTIVSRTGFCATVARELGSPLHLVIAHFKGGPVLSTQQRFKSDDKPVLASTRESFEHAVRNSGLTPEQQSFLLGL